MHRARQVLALGLLAGAWQGSANAQDLSQIRIGAQSTNTSTTTANGYYPTGLTSTREFWGPDPMANRPAELKELARALHNNVDLIYEYVHDNVRTTFMYGLQKGALGALIDQSGTPFDQAQLMVELLREAGYSARYKVGTVRLTTAQANAWIGTSGNTTALQQIFRDGGIPLNYSSGTFTIGHVWVEVTIPGAGCASTCWFDPAYKTNTFTAPLANLNTLMGMATNEFDTANGTGFFGQAWSGMQVQGTTDPVWVSGVNHGNVQSKLQGYATTLLTNLKSATHSAKEIEAVVGGQAIVAIGATPVRNAGTLPGFTPITVQRTWDCSGATTCGVPDPYRTKLTVTMIDYHPNPDVVLIQKAFYVDEIYGRRLYVDIPQNIYAPDTGLAGSYERLCYQLTLDGVAIASTVAEPTTVGCTTPATKVNPLGRTFRVRLEVDHPYAASAGAYMDLSAGAGTQVEKMTSLYAPVIIVHGWGEVSPALVSKLASEQRDDRLMPVVDPDPGTGGYEPGFRKGDSAMDHTMVKLGASYLAQYSRLAELNQRLGNAVHVMHHTVGIVYSEADPENGWAMNPNPPNTDNEWRLRDRAIRINVDGAISVNSKSNTAAERRKVIHATLATAATIEGSIFEQMLDAPFVGSTATRFQWASANLPTTKFYLFRPTSPAPGGGLGSDFPTLGCVPVQLSPNALPDYVNATQGFWAIAAGEKCLGPGNRYGPYSGSGLAVPSMQRGPAFVAFKPDDSSLAHVVGYSEINASDTYKGGGAAVAPSYAREFDAAGAASLLKDRFEDRSRLHGVDLNSGELTYSAPPDLSVGEGGFPYELSFQRSFKPGGSASPGYPDGWAHNLDVRIRFSGDGLAKMGRDSAQAAAESIAAIYATQQIYSVAPTLNASTTPAVMRDHLKRWVLAPFVLQWWGSKLNYNVATLNAGHEARQFTRFADGLFYPPRNGVGTLTQTGQRQLHVEQGVSYPETTYDRWDYSPVSFSYLSPERDLQSFGYFEVDNGYDPLQPNTERSSGRQVGWHLSTWSFPYNVVLTYSYTNTPLTIGPFVDRLVTVSNNLGRALTLGYSGSFDLDGVLLSSVSDGLGRTTSYAQPALYWQDRVLTQATSAESSNGAEVTKYDYVGNGQNVAEIPAGARPQVYPKLRKVFAPIDGTTARWQADYDRTWRTKEYRDGVAIATPANRAPSTFFITGSNRGERADPLANAYTAYYDDRSRAIRLIDEENRTVTQTFDNHDRVTERTQPEGNKPQLTYDDPTQQIKSITQVQKATAYWSGAIANVVVQATYDPTCGRLKSVTDAKAKVTTWNYHATACTLTSVQQPPVANPQAGGALATPTTSYLYNGFGQLTQVTDPTSRVVSFEYNPTSNYRLRRRVDPAGLNLITTYGHDFFGNIDSIDGPRSDVTDVTSYSFDKQRRLTKVTAPLGQITRQCYDRDGDVLAVHRTRFNNAPADPACAGTYDPANWQSWLTSYTPTKAVDLQTSPTGAVTNTDYDGADRVAVVTDPDGRKVQTQYFNDGATRKIVKAYASPNMAAIDYATYTRTPNGQVDTVADANGNVTNLDYDGLDRPHRTFFSDPAAGGTPCAPALPHSASAPTCTAAQTYEQLSYDPNGNVTAKRNRSGISLAFVFDDLNRETTRTVPDNPAVAGNLVRTLTSSYDLAGRTWDATADSQTLANRYDAAGRLDYVDDSYLGASNNRINPGYDAAGNRSSLVYPGGTSVSFSFDALNRLDLVTEGGVTLADYDWDTLSRRDLVRFNGNAFSADLGYEADDDLNSITHSGPAPLTFTLGRNVSSQLTSLAASDGAFLSRPASTLSEAYAPNRLNQYASVAGSTQTHDLNGNLTSDGTYTFTYDEENRLRTASGAGNTSSYEYDPAGRRRAKVVNGVTTRYASEGAEEIEERDASQVVLRKYVYGSSVDDRVAMLDAACAGGGRCFYLTNWQGSTTTLVNQSGTLNAVYHYGPFGEGTNWTPVDALTGNPFRYTGRRVDPETGLYYYRARYYSPRTGRFLQTDPIGARDDLNLYAYVANDPANRMDPTGECGLPCAGLGIAVYVIVQEVTDQPITAQGVVIAGLLGAIGSPVAASLGKTAQVGAELAMAKTGLDLAAGQVAKAGATMAAAGTLAAGGKVANNVADSLSETGEGPTHPLAGAGTAFVIGAATAPIDELAGVNAPAASAASKAGAQARSTSASVAAEVAGAKQDSQQSSACSRKAADSKSGCN